MSSAIVDEIKKNAEEKAFSGYLSEFLSWFFYRKAFVSALIAATSKDTGQKNGGKAKGVLR